MSNNLDKSLEEIIDEAGGALAGATKHKVEKIKQAFIDEGWMSTGISKSVKNVTGLMTYDEWQRQAVKDGWVKQQINVNVKASELTK